LAWRSVRNIYPYVVRSHIFMAGKQMTTPAYELLNTALSMNARWFSRKELAKIIGRAGWTLQAQDLTALDTLVSEQKIERRRIKRPGMGLPIWEYRRIEK